MYKNVFKYLITGLIICIFFSIVTIVNNNIDNSYPDVKKMDFVVNETIQDTESLDLTPEHTVIYRDDNTNSDLFSECYYALMVNDTDNIVYAAKNVHQRMYPASMTKFMTAIIVCEKIEAGEISLDDVVTVNTIYDLTSEGVLAFEFTYGCQITVKDLLYGLLIESNNYYALMLADYVAGSESAFCELMNAKAQEIGATNTHFMNPHGLDDPNHYSTAYDIYLITKEAHKHELIRTIDSYDSYSYTYTNADGYIVDVDITATNYFINDKVDLPANFNIEVWKTGTTNGAGNCLAMWLTKDNKTYIAIASCGDSKPALYDAMVRLICLIG